MSEHHHTIIIGAGLSGMYLAWRLSLKLTDSQNDIILLEARNRCGGRILSLVHNNTSRIDMGPAWVWPDLQPRLQMLITELDIKVFKQFTTGDMLYEKTPTDIERHNGASSHSQSYRIAGGSQSIIDALQTKISKNNIHLNTHVQSINQNNLSINSLREGKPLQYTADNIILALPPRLINQHIRFEPALPTQVTQVWSEIPTWMSAHSKIVFIYAAPFWREQKLSGEVLSHHGPLSEIYDGSPITEEYYALTSFVGINAQQRAQVSESQLIEACMAQLHRLFGDESKNIVEIKIKDWSQDKNTTTASDITGPMQPPHYAEQMPRSFCNNHLLLAGSEVAIEHGGYLEGALESADEVVSLMKGSF